MRKNFLVVLIFVIAFLLRFIGTKPGYNQYHSDEGITYSAAVSMIKNGNLDPLRYDYPALVPLVNYFFFKFVFIPISWSFYYISHIPQIIDGLVHIPIAPLEKAKIFQVSILGEREINALFLGRYVTALFSLGNVLMVYFLGKNIFNKKVGLLASLLLAVNFKAVENSHIGLPDTYNAFFLLLSLFFSYRIITKPLSANYLLAGIFLGLSFSTKYQIFAVFPFLLSHLYVSFPRIKRIFSKNVLLTGFAAVFVFVLLNPYVWLHLEPAIEILSYVSKKYSMGRMGLMTYPLYYFYSVDYGLPLLLACLVGLFYSLKKFTRETFFLLSVVIPFLFVMLYYSIGGFYVRNLITITPILLIFGSVLMVAIFDWAKKFRFLKYFSAIVLLGVIYLPLKNSLINSYYYTKPWPYKTIVEKVGSLLPEGSLVASHPFDPLPGNIERADFKRESSYSLAEFREKGVDYALINMDWASADFYGWMLSTFPKSLTYLQKPVVKMRDTFSAISIEEMMNYVITSSYKPWQAPDAALFLLKVPYFTGVRFLGPIAVNLNERINIKSDFVYKLTGQLKSGQKVEESGRDVFLRMDFFDKEDKYLLTSVSPRYFGDGWKNLEILTPAPNGSVYAKVSLQAYGGVIDQYVLKDSLLEESLSSYNSMEDYEKIEYDRYRDLIFPNSHGNL